MESPFKKSKVESVSSSSLLSYEHRGAVSIKYLVGHKGGGSLTAKARSKLPAAKAPCWLG